MGGSSIGVGGLGGTDMRVQGMDRSTIPRSMRSDSSDSDDSNGHKDAKLSFQIGKSIEGVLQATPYLDEFKHQLGKLSTPFIQRHVVAFHILL